ncbi:MAG: 4Fe-4S dicluster domain-containing protein, partial [Chloroflexota bacterium]|nr:4Fe-4S dicluster domain-containing protein [Chloroflexota bacterium]
MVADSQTVTSPSVADRLGSPAAQGLIALTAIGLLLILLADMTYSPLRIAGIAVISVGAAALGVVVGVGPPSPRGRENALPANAGTAAVLTLAAVAPIVAAIAWGATGLIESWRPGARLLTPAAGGPTRQILFNVDLAGQVALYALMAPAMALLAFGLARRAAMWQLGQPENRFDHLAGRTWAAIRASILHGRTVRRSNLYGGLMHLAIFWGFVVLLIGTIIVMIESDITVPLLGWSFYRGGFYLGFKVAMSAAGVALIAGVLMAYAVRARRPRVKETSRDDLLLLTALFVLTLQGFLLQALRQAAVNDPWLAWSFGSYPLVLLVRPLPLPSLLTLHSWMWWTHFLSANLFVGYIVYSKMVHVFTGLANVLFRRLKPRGQLDSIENLEEAESFGVGRLRDFSWAQLLSVDACMHCGRCLEYCPTFNTGKPLRPRDLVLEIAGYQADSGGLFSGELGQEANSGRFRWGKGSERELIGGVVSTDELWDCTTCGACMEQCPVYIEHVPMIVGMRRNLVLEQADFPEELVPLFNNMEKNFNPWEYPASQRGAWA